MSLTPVEIRHATFRRRPLGYARSAVDRFLEDVTVSFEDVWRERADLRDEVERLEGEVDRYRELDVLLRNSLVSAERAADDLRAQAGKEADVILDEARIRAREIVAQAEAERERLRGEVRRLKGLEAEVRARYRAFLADALRRVDGDVDDEPGAPANGTARAPGHAA